jgi:hypothetical protein
MNFHTNNQQKFHHKTDMRINRTPTINRPSLSFANYGLGRRDGE